MKYRGDIPERSDFYSGVLFRFIPVYSGYSGILFRIFRFSLFIGKPKEKSSFLTWRHMPTIFTTFLMLGLFPPSRIIMEHSYTFASHMGVLYETFKKGSGLEMLSQFKSSQIFNSRSQSNQGDSSI